MHPIVGVLELGEASVPIGSYGLFAAAGVLVAGGLATRAAWRAGLDVGLVLAAIALTIGFGFTGAWATFAAVETLRTGSIDWLANGGGLVFFGALPGGALGLWVARRWLKLDVLRGLELALPGVAAAHALGRIGCFFGGCCYGRPFDGAWAVVYPGPGAAPRHPTPLYESAGLLALAFAFALSPPRRPGSGQRAAAYVAGYCALRLLTELFRGDLVRGVVAGVSTSQAIAAVGLLLAAFAGRRLAQQS